MFCPPALQHTLSMFGEFSSCGRLDFPKLAYVDPIPHILFTTDSPSSHRKMGVTFPLIESGQVECESSGQ